jgi:NADPH:quinone reductase-like Zn-dependent oxidoreductase
MLPSSFRWPGEVVAVGPKVTLFHKGQCVSPTYFQDFHANTLTLKQARRDLGGNIDGVISEYGIFNGNGLAEIHLSLSYRQAATLPCVGLIAWNALSVGKEFRPEQMVLTQGKGGVSMFTDGVLLLKAHR